MIELTWLIFLCAVHNTIGIHYFDNFETIDSCGYKIDQENSFEQDVKCHMSEVHGDLPSADTIHFPKNSIFFIETSCKGGLSGRQACGVESAAIAHPKRQIIVLFAGPVLKYCLKTKPFNVLLEYDNVRLYRIHIAAYSKDTPMESWMTGSNWNKVMDSSRFPVIRTSDVLRYLTLYKFGGVYLDFDVIVAWSFDFLPVPSNWVGRDQEYNLGSAAISATRNGIGGAFTSAVLRIMKKSFESNCKNCSNNYTQALALDEMCIDSDIATISAATCQGFEVYKPIYFYPINSLLFKKLFFREDINFYNQTFAFHTWNSQSKSKTITKGSLYWRLAQAYCPKIASKCKTKRTLLTCPKKDVMEFMKDKLTYKLEEWRKSLVPSYNFSLNDE